MTAEIEQLKERQALLQEELSAVKRRLSLIENNLGMAEPKRSSAAEQPEAGGIPVVKTSELVGESTPPIARPSWSEPAALISPRTIPIPPPIRAVALRTVQQEQETVTAQVEAPAEPPAGTPVVSVDEIVPLVVESLTIAPVPTMETPIPGNGMEPETSCDARRLVPVAQPAGATVVQPEGVMPEPEAAMEPVITRVSAESERVKESSFELQLGTYWLVRIGIVMILTGLVFAATYAYRNYVGRLGPGGKVGLLYFAGGALLGVGAWLQRKEQKTSLKNYGQVLFAGGMAAVYFTTFAAHHFPNLRVIVSAALDGVLLLSWAGFMVWLADQKKSELMAWFAIGLAYYTSFITNVGLFTLYSNLVLTMAAVFFLLRNRWAMLSYGSLVATYAGFAFWRFHHNDGWLWDLRVEDVWTGNWFLAGYWMSFTAAVFLSRFDQLARGSRAAFSTLNNGAFFSLVLLSMLHVSRGSLWKFSLAYGAVLLGLAGLARRFLNREMAVRNAYVTQGLLLVTVGFISYFAGLNLGLVLAAESLVLVMLGGQLKNPILRGGAQVVAALAVGLGLAHQQAFEWTGLLVGATIGAIMGFNAFWDQRQNDAEQKPVSFPTGFYTVLGLLIWWVTTWNNTDPAWRGLVFAVESTCDLVLAPPLRNEALRFGAYPFAAFAVAWQLYELYVRDGDPGTLPLGVGAGIGVLMLANAMVVRWRRPEVSVAAIQWESVCFSALAQAIWLVTTWSADQNWRALLFAAESVSFLLASRYLKSRVFEAGASVAAVLAVGLQSYAMLPFDRPGLCRGVMIGAMILLNAFEHRTRRDQLTAEQRRWQEMFFTTLALLMWAVTTWQNSATQWRALILAMESVVFLMAGDMVKNAALRCSTYAFAGVSVVWGIYDLSRQYMGVELNLRVGGYQAAVVGLLMMVDALWERRRGVVTEGATLRVPETVFSVFALVVWLVTTWTFTPTPYLAPLLGFEAGVFTAAIYAPRLRELTLLGQAFLLLGQLQCIVCLLSGQPQLPWWNPAVTAVISVGLGHWWQRQRSLDCTEVMRQAWQGLYGLATVGLLFCWLHPVFSPPTWMAVTSLLAVVMTGYGLLTRAWFLAGFGQVFLGVSAGEFCYQLWAGSHGAEPEWFYALTPIATLFVFAGPLYRYLERIQLIGPGLREPLWAMSLIYRGVALLMAVGWIFEYITQQDRFWTLALVGVVFFAWSGWCRMREPLYLGAAFTLIGFGTFGLGFNDATVVHWPNLPAILALLLQQRAARRWPVVFPLHAHVHTGMILLGASSVWLFCSRLVILKAGGFGLYLTAAWAVLALVIFCVGFAWRERIYRWHGLSVLACALGRVVIFDVWRLETVYRILSFLALGGVLLVLGFIYSKYQEKIKEWL